MVGARQGGVDFDQFAHHGQRITIPRVVFRMIVHRYIAGRIHPAHLEPNRDFSQCLVGFRVLRQRDHDALAAQDAGFLPRNLAHR